MSSWLSSQPSEPATFVQRLHNVFQTSMAFETRWVVVVQTSLVHWERMKPILNVSALKERSPITKDKKKLKIVELIPLRYTLSS